MMVSEFVCIFHGNTVDPGAGKPCRVIIKYGKNYDRYWTVEYVVIHIQYTRITLIKIHLGCLSLYVFNTLETITR